jgi:leucyl-tRNA synthetase
MGAHVDWRRSFITTDHNPFYDAFVRWQFTHLKAKDYVAFGQRPTVFSPLDGQACADHDRASGEGAVPQEYTLIKMKVLRGEDGKLPSALSDIDEDGVERDVYLVAATLRPETMYGQTNCFVLPEGEYGAFEMKASADGKAQAYICSERSAVNMAWQEMTPEEGNAEKLAEFTGSQLMGLAVAAPNAAYEKVYVLPLMTISMGKGTGVVTSVPSDAPDDYAALMDLKNKPKLREKFGIEDHMVLPYEVVEIIEIPGYGRAAAVTLCQKMGIKSQNDKIKLAQAKEEVYLKGFYEGVMLKGSAAGKTVQEAKPIVRAEMLSAGQAAIYWEPEREVMSRSGDECVVSFVDQWYLNYGEEEWKAKVLQHVRSEHFTSFNPSAMNMYEHTLGWLREWACSRSFGLGTRVPWDPTYVIESLSDSTVYMAYYTIAHKLQGGDLTGATLGPANIKAEQLTSAVFDYIFLKAEFPADCGIAEATLAELRKEFEYWYPLDLRVSGKDLIQNHLTMALYNHAAIWGGSHDRMPRAYFTNGHVMVNGAKMSKSQGNFMILEEAVARWSADGVRFGLADAGDTLDDGNFEGTVADSGVLRLTNEEDAFVEVMAQVSSGTLRTGGAEAWNFMDKVFHARQVVSMAQAAEAYDDMRFQAALKFGFWVLLDARDKYKAGCAKLGVEMNAGLIQQWMVKLVISIAPICPHWADHMYCNVLNKPTGADTVVQARWPDAEEYDAKALTAGTWFDARLHMWRADIDAKLKQGKVHGKPEAAVVYVATSYSDWQKAVLASLAASFQDGQFTKTAMKDASKVLKADKAMARHMKNAMSFGKARMDEAMAGNLAALALEPQDNELALLQDNLVFVEQSLDIAPVQIVDAASAEFAAVPAAQRAVPGAPVFQVQKWSE